MGPHFSARDFCSPGDGSEDPDVGDEDVSEEGREVALRLEDPEGVGVACVWVGSGGKDRDRVVEPVGVTEANNEAELEASAGQSAR